MRFSKVGIAQDMYVISSDVSVKSQVIGSIIIIITTETTTTTTTTITSQKAIEVEQCEMPPPPYFHHPEDQPDLLEVYINRTICTIVQQVFC